MNNDNLYISLIFCLMIFIVLSDKACQVSSCQLLILVQRFLAMHFLLCMNTKETILQSQPIYSMMVYGYAKTSTYVLFDANGKVASFGFDAEKKYSELASENKHRDWYYFRRFKMMLYNETVNINVHPI